MLGRTEAPRRQHLRRSRCAGPGRLNTVITGLSRSACTSHRALVALGACGGHAGYPIHQYLFDEESIAFVAGGFRAWWRREHGEEDPARQFRCGCRADEFVCGSYVQFTG